MEKIFEDYKGLVLFYILIAIISLLFSIRINNVNQEANKTITNIETYYA